MPTIWLYTLASVTIVSLISLIGIFTLAVTTQSLQKILLYLISLSAGTLIGDAFIHLLPEAAKPEGFTVAVSLYTISGIVMFFIIEKIVHWRHCHHVTTEDHPHPFAWMNLFGDSVHNLIDGLIIGASFLASVPVGIATTIAVILHEIPQEIGDFGVLIHGGFSTKKAIALNFLTALAAVLGAVIALLIGQYAETPTEFLIPFAAGGFIYIASADLIPELHKETTIKKSLLQLASFIIGIAAMMSLLYLE